MARYDSIFTNLATRAVEQGGIDADAFLNMALDSGVSEQAILEALENDVQSNGPIFGKFLRSLTGAAQASVTAAGRQGETIGEVEGDEELRRLLGIAEGDGSSVFDDLREEADPELASEIEEASAEHLEEVWVCALKNTCPRCLPLHGQVRTRAEWQELGLLPELMHEGWTSDCMCRLVSVKVAGNVKAPLVRVRDEMGKDKLPGQKKTARAITQADLDRAFAAREEALKTPEGRRTLRLLGQALAEDGS